MADIEGLDSLQEQLTDLPKEILKIVKRAIYKEMAKVQAEAKMNVAVDTGELRSSIVVRITEEDGEITGKVITTVPHGVYVEMGTGPMGEAHHEGIAPVPVTYRTTPWVLKNPKSKKTYITKGMAARPYLYPAFARRKKNIAKNIHAYLKKEGL